MRLSNEDSIGPTRRRRCWLLASSIVGHAPLAVCRPPPAQHLLVGIWLHRGCVLSVFAQRCCCCCCCHNTETACVHNRACNVAKSPDLASQFQQTAASVAHFAWGKTDDGAFSVPARLYGVLQYLGHPRAASVSPPGRCERTKGLAASAAALSVIGCAPGSKWARAVAWIWGGEGGRRLGGREMMGTVGGKGGAKRRTLLDGC